MLLKLVIGLWAFVNGTQKLTGSIIPLCNLLAVLVVP